MSFLRENYCLWPALPVKTCEGCGVEFIPNYSTQRFHSQPCSLRRFNLNSDHQQEQGRKGGTRHAQIVKSTAQYKSYLPGARKAMSRHREVATEVLGRDLLPGEVVHHEDNDKKNNDPSNLVVFQSQGQHARHHKLAHKTDCDCVGVWLKEVMPK